MAESKLSTTPSSSNLPKSSVEFVVALLVLVSLAKTLYLWLGLHLEGLLRRLVASSGRPPLPGF